MEKEILNIYCPNCGAPAAFDIVQQVYACGYCGGKVQIEEAVAQKQELIRERRKNLRGTAGQYDLATASCSGCGAELIFEKGEALSNCAFCGRSLVRKKFLFDEKLPQSVIPFAVTEEEAREKLQEWCTRNKNKQEAKHLQMKLQDLKSFYLPYEMARGPVTCQVKHVQETQRYEAHGYLQDAFVNCSKQLDNLVLDAMEPYDPEDLHAFDFAYVAGQRVKISDVTESQIRDRLRRETEENYRPYMEKIWGSRALEMETVVDSAYRIPVLLPVYYIADGEVQAAVNGQTGKVSVRAEKESAYISPPWWVSGLLILAGALGCVFAAARFSGTSIQESLFYAGALGFFFLIVFPCMFADGSNGGNITHYRNIFTSGKEMYRRERGVLVLREEELKRRIQEPVFLAKLDGKEQPVSYTFRSMRRMISMIVTAIVVVLLPVIAALFVNGFQFAQLKLGGSAVWFCITVPLAPILLIQIGIKELYRSPWIYVYGENGTKKRYKVKSDEPKSVLKMLGGILALLIVPPICFAVWFAIAAFATMVYLTAFGF